MLRQRSESGNKLLEALAQANEVIVDFNTSETAEINIQDLYGYKERPLYEEDGSYNTKNDGYFTKTADFVSSLRERAKNMTRAKVVAGAFAVASALGLAYNFATSDNEARASVAEQIAQNDFSASNNSSSSSSEAQPATAIKVEQNQANNKEAMDQAIQDKLAEIGLKPGQYTEVTDPNATLPGPAEANYYSLNGGSQVWGNYERTINGAKQMSQDLLNAHDEFSSDRAFVSMAAMKHFGASDKLLAQLAAGNYDDIEIKFFTLNGDKAVYHDMSFNNNGSLGIENDRTVAPLSEDAITIISFKDENGAIKTISTRVDCGVMQAFGSVTVYGTPPQPVVSKPSKPARPSKPEKPCPPGTTAPPTTTPETTPPTTVPPTTTPETTPPTTTIPPKDDPGTVPGPGTGHGETPTEPATPDDGSDNPVGGTVPTPTTPPTTPETPPTTPPTTTRPVTPNEEPVYTQPPAPVG